MAPLRFAITSPPSGCQEDFHLRAVEHARHTKKKAGCMSTRRRRNPLSELLRTETEDVEELFGAARLSEEAAVTEAGDFPAGNAIFGEDRRQQEIENVRFCRAIAARR